MSKFSRIRSKAALIGSINPAAWDAIIPHSHFPFANAHFELMVADVVKTISSVVKDQKLGKKVLELSLEMAKQATGAMVATWEPGDDICPPWPWPWPGPNPWTRIDENLDPEPVPWKPVIAAEQIELGHILTNLAGLTTSKDFNRSLKAIGTEIAKGAASSLVDEFERCGTVPRKPFPKRGGKSQGVK